MAPDDFLGSIRALDRRSDRAIGFALGITAAISMVTRRDDLPASVRLSLFAALSELRPAETGKDTNQITRAA